MPRAPHSIGRRWQARASRMFSSTGHVSSIRIHILVDNGQTTISGRRGAFVMALDVFLKRSFNSAEHRVMTP
eukprot:g6628.t1